MRRSICDHLRDGYRVAWENLQSAASVETGHEFAVGRAGGGQVLVAFGQAGSELLVVLGELDDLLFQLAGVVRG